MIFYTSDTHFYHANVIEYCRRPFVGLADMHETMIRRWNEKVGPGDVVFHLGDFSFGNREQQKSVCSQLHGSKILIRGNHDGSVARMLDVGFEEVLNDYVASDMITALPYPLQPYLRHAPDFGHAGLHLCGHVHEKWRRQGHIINVGVDQWDFTPRTLEELLRTGEGRVAPGVR